MVIWYPLTMTFDTLSTTDILRVECLPFKELKEEARRYVVGDRPPHYPVPAIGNEMILVHPVVLWMHWHCDEYGVMPD